uniref:BLUF domain-containing protein n=1 Tax=Chlamydomonas leiostraca TaxID=1034604 RepID=A0A7S0RVP4_9CHLO|mmetsp:Transcript_31276/g.79759  ORF Transcript_31276/g.79759 Transcript_31276/m.79759 type:complete len:232 (+) Transcript_31276:98-793(+)|eukprot:CAMPEP_0202872764 /NCGR_PEP_ID=MMETSP1391-20130828/21955_1 /ASSEMBLY_ACC=CAM_ASM_000867 /TAXON_ID=1034604 /ORGANISM="Chlamydomonas leiostraca, Strain SAG 11-49" /LENGTH=231 /DNA_ID=CAMNT_0049553891 /DNA_START=46 /DNA_END=741 /DNA_ORIENTATION=-
MAEPSRETLLDVVIDKLQKSGKNTIISRIILVGRYVRREQSIDYHKAFYSKLVDKHSQEGEITGLLLCYPSCMVHLLEAKTSVLMHLLRDLEAAGQAETRLAEARVVASTEDIPVRCFSAWYAGWVSTAGSAETMDAVDSTTIVKTASELNSFMRKIGPSLVGLSDSDLARRLATMESYHEDTPAAELVLSLVPAEDAPTLEEYMSIFDTPLNVDLDSEQTWPMPRPLQAV